MNVFIDTEFTSLSDPRLISVGAVSEHGATFYGIVEGVPLSLCTSFVREHVLPVLHAQPADIRGSHREVSAAFVAWLGSWVERDLWVDDECDKELVGALLRHDDPARANATRIHMQTADKQRQARAAMSLWFESSSDRKRHNALDDARAYRYACGITE